MRKNIPIIGVIIALLVLGQVVQGQDWPNLNCFREKNAMLKTPLEDENRVVFMGNSITEMWNEVSPAFFKKPEYINRGISGQTTPQMLIRFRQDVIDLKPKVVVILAGTNDIAGNTGPSTLEMIEGNIASMAELASANGIKVILCSVLPAYDYPWAPGEDPVHKIPRINNWIKKYADENEFIYLDYFSDMVDGRGGMKVEFSEDGVHPNKDGYNAMEPLVEKAIRSALAKQ